MSLSADAMSSSMEDMSDAHTKDLKLIQQKLDKQKDMIRGKRNKRQQADQKAFNMKKACCSQLKDIQLFSAILRNS